MRLQQKSITRVTQVLFIGQDEELLSEIAHALSDLPKVALSHEPDLETILVRNADLAANIILLDFVTPIQQSTDIFNILRQRFPEKHLILLADETTLARAGHLAEENGLDYIAKSELSPEVLQRAVRYGRNQQRLRTELAFINQIGHHLISTLDLNEVQAIALEEVRSLLDVMACSIWLFDAETGELVCQQVAGPGRENIRGWRLQPGQGIVGWVAQFGEALLIQDTWRDPRHYTQIDQKTGLPIRSTLCLPLKTKQRILGTLQLVDTTVGRFTHSDLLLLEPVAAATAIAIENAQLFYLAQQEIAERKYAEEELRSRNQELDRLYRASDTLLASASPDITQLAESIVQTIQREFAKANCSLILRDTETSQLVRVAALGPYADEVKRSQLSLSGGGLIPEVIRTGRPFNSGDVKALKGYIEGWQLANSELTVPLMVDDRVIGAIDVQSAHHNAFNQDDERLLSNFADRAALALQNARLFNETQRWARELDLLNHIVSTIASGVSREEIFQAVCVELAHFLDIPYAFICILGEDGRAQTIMTEHLPPDCPSQVGKQLSISSNGLFQAVFESSAPFVSSEFDPRSNEDLAALCPAFTAVSRPVALLIVPIVIRRQVFAGSLILISPEKGAINANAVRLAKVVGEELGSALENLRLSYQLKAHAAELEERVAARTEDLRIANTQLVQALQSRDEFLASMSHELRTPLNA
ncbi:MAG: GAF domain-containing protein, partial [Anaerolineales bacterium]|nr:GAF domain-containing protein [Anaerolineales bacterium]